MPTIFLMSLFGFLMAIMASLVINSGPSRQLFTQALIRQNIDYFKSISTLVNKDIVPNYYELSPRPLSGMTPQQAGEAFLNQQSIKRLGVPNRFNDPLRDSWGTPITVHMIRENIAFDSKTVAPVSGILLLSAGPDLIVQTAVNVAPTLLAYQGISPAGDDILIFFTDEEPLKVIYNDMFQNLEKIKNSLEQDFNQRLTDYRNQLSGSYAAAFAADPNFTPPDFLTTFMTDPNAPRFADISNATVRQRLGIEPAVNEIERLLPTGGRMRLGVIGMVQPLEMTFGLFNDPVNPSPWPNGEDGSIGPRIKIKINL